MITEDEILRNVPKLSVIETQFYFICNWSNLYKSSINTGTKFRFLYFYVIIQFTRAWIYRSMKVVYVGNDTKLWSPIPVRNVRPDSWKKRIHYGKFDVLLETSSHLSFLHDCCTVQVSFELRSEKVSFHPVRNKFARGASGNSLIKLAWH